MSSTYTTSLQIQLMGNGDQSGTWGTTTNTNWNLIEAAVAGSVSIVMSNANRTLTTANGAADEARNMTLIVSGSNSAVYQVIAPLVPKIYNVVNNTTGGYAITIGGASGATVSIPNGYACFVYCDGTNFYACDTASGGNFYVNGTLKVTGTSTFTGAATFSSTVTATSFSGSGASLTGVTASSLSTTDYTISESGGKLYFAYQGTNVASLDSSGNFITLTSVSGGQTP